MITSVCMLVFFIFSSEYVRTPRAALIPCIKAWMWFYIVPSISMFVSYITADHTHTHSLLLDVMFLSLMAFGTFLRLWAMTTLGKHFTLIVVRKNAHAYNLVRNGPYRFVRHPGYLSFFFILPPLAFLLSRHTTYSLIMSAVIVWFYRRVSRYEDVSLEKLFGKAFTKYKAETPAFIPQLTCKS